MAGSAQQDMPRLPELAEVTFRYKVAVYVPEAEMEQVKEAGENEIELHQYD